jgi:hypothetical protein
MSQEAADHYRSLAASYTDTIRVTDFKSNIVIVFVAIMLSPVLGLRDKYPAFLPLPVVLFPFFIVFFCLLIALYPRYPRIGRSTFVVSGASSPDHFVFSFTEEEDILNLQFLCATLSRILYWKTLFLQLSLSICMIAVVIAALVLAYLGV